MEDNNIWCAVTPVIWYVTTNFRNLDVIGINDITAASDSIESS